MVDLEAIVLRAADAADHGDKDDVAICRAAMSGAPPRRDRGTAPGDVRGKELCPDDVAYISQRLRGWSVTAVAGGAVLSADCGTAHVAVLRSPDGTYHMDLAFRDLDHLTPVLMALSSLAAGPPDAEEFDIVGC